MLQDARAVIAFYSFAAPPNVHVVDVQYTQHTSNSSSHFTLSTIALHTFTVAAHRPEETMRCCCAFVCSLVALLFGVEWKWKELKRDSLQSSCGWKASKLLSGPQKEREINVNHSGTNSKENFQEKILAVFDINNFGNLNFAIPWLNQMESKLLSSFNALFKKNYHQYIIYFLYL